MTLPETFGSVLHRRLLWLPARTNRKIGSPTSMEALSQLTLAQVQANDWEPWSGVLGGSAWPDDAFTVMSWNSLAQSLVRRDLFPYCSKAQLRWKYRKDRLLAEFLFYRPSIACFQEIDKEFWQSEWAPLMASLNYHWHYYGYRAKKHGCCIVWNAGKWRCDGYRCVDLDQSQKVQGLTLPSDNVLQLAVLTRLGPDSRMDSLSPVNSTHTEETPDHPNRASSHPQRPYAPLASGTQQGVLVTNCHLYWRPTGGAVRLAQGLVIQREVDAMHQEYGGGTLPTVLCGDFNSSPAEGLYSAFHHTGVTAHDSLVQDLVTSFELDPRLAGMAKPPTAEPASTPDIQPAVVEDPRLMTSQQQREWVIQLMRAHQSYPPIRSVYQKYEEVDPQHYALAETAESTGQPFFTKYGFHPLVGYQPKQWAGEPRFSNYGVYRGLLDYIFYRQPSRPLKAQSESNHHDCLQPVGVLSIPPESTLLPGIPNDAFGSDHISLLAVFVLTK
ncbi:RNA exonuclease ngl2 [Dispira parvispora]|uniref:RNA exonuclease ngl2 n=1 Tax=Dispira parvispora TaxID=1520584 RepID=A0A9W8E8P5_9FUNG|nr:RNA exonuclease ngl2 [Dispira parvispora]